MITIFGIKKYTLGFLTVTALLLLLAAPPASSDIYTWTDQNGVKHFSNQPPQNTQNTQQRQEIKHDRIQYEQWNERRKKDQAKILRTNKPINHAVQKQSSRKGQVMPDPGKVVMYVTPTCGYCKRARSFFTEHNISFTEYDITNDKSAHNRFKRLNGRGVPLIMVGEQKIAGFNKPLLRKLLGIK